MQKKLRIQQLQQEFKRTDSVAPGLEPVLSKHQKMALNPFRFLRGSSGLFYADIKNSVLKLPKTLTTEIPLTTVVGDCHLSNFGFLLKRDPLVTESFLLQMILMTLVLVMRCGTGVVLLSVFYWLRIIVRV